MRLTRCLLRYQGCLGHLRSHNGAHLAITGTCAQRITCSLLYGTYEVIYLYSLLYGTYEVLELMMLTYYETYEV